MSSKERIDHLRQYIRGCLASGLLTPTDLTNGKIVEKLLKIISQDTHIIVRELAREGIAGLARMGVMKLASIAEKMAK